jgi:hypothetical protein
MSPGVTVRRFLAPLALGLLVLGLLAPPASAGANVAAASDPVGDGRFGGDLVALRTSTDATRLILQVRTSQPLDVRTAPAWTRPGSTTLLRFDIYDTAATPDYLVLLRRGANGPVGQVVKPGSGPVPGAGCVTVTQPAKVLIRVAVRFTCLPDAQSARVAARYRFDSRGDGSVNSNDRAPDEGTAGTIDFPG